MSTPPTLSERRENDRNDKLKILLDKVKILTKLCEKTNIKDSFHKIDFKIHALINDSNYINLKEATDSINNIELNTDIFFLYRINDLLYQEKIGRKIYDYIVGLINHINSIKDVLEDINIITEISENVLKRIFISMIDIPIRKFKLSKIYNIIIKDNKPLKETIIDYLIFYNTDIYEKIKYDLELFIKILDIKVNGVSFGGSKKRRTRKHIKR